MYLRMANEMIFAKQLYTHVIIVQLSTIMMNQNKYLTSSLFGFLCHLISLYILIWKAMVMWLESFIRFVSDLMSIASTLLSRKTAKSPKLNKIEISNDILTDLVFGVIQLNDHTSSLWWREVTIGQWEAHCLQMLLDFHLTAAIEFSNGQISNGQLQLWEEFQLNTDWISYQNQRPGWIIIISISYAVSLQYSVLETPSSIQWAVNRANEYNLIIFEALVPYFCSASFLLAFCVLLFACYLLDSRVASDPPASHATHKAYAILEHRIEQCEERRNVCFFFCPFPATRVSFGAI